jgi:hypothetical protein
MRMVSVPPYCGTCALGVAVAVVVGLVVAVVGVVVGLVVGVDIGVVVGVVFVPHDTSTRDSAIRQLNINHKTFLFICLTPFLSINYFDALTESPQMDTK